MVGERIGVGIVGVEPGRSWGAQAHVPALRTLSGTFAIAGIANSSPESGERAGAGMGLSSYPDVAALIAAPDVHVVAITVRVPRHRAIVAAAIAAGKHVYCEWPLGNGLAEAEELAALARAAGVVAVVGTQAVVAPEILRMRQLVAGGFVGEVLSSTLSLRSHGWGGIVPDVSRYAYLMDRSQGATMLTIPVGHALSAVRAVLGDFRSLSAELATRRTTALIVDTGGTISVDAPDQVLVGGSLESGALVSLHCRGGTRLYDGGLLWEINGTQGDLRLTGPLGHIQNMPLTLGAARGDEKAFQPLGLAETEDDLLEDRSIGNVARLYARLAQDIRGGTLTTPRFDDAVVLHRQIAAIDHSAAEGRRIRLADV